MPGSLPGALSNAVENLGGIPQRRTPAEAGVEHVASTPAAPAPGPPAGKTPEDHQALAAQIEKRFDELRTKPDHFSTLGIDRNASRDQVKTAFLSLAKVFHPDRLPPALSTPLGRREKRV